MRTRAYACARAHAIQHNSIHIHKDMHMRNSKCIPHLTLSCGCMCGQFGKKAINGLWDRTEVFDQTYDALLDSLKTGGALRGVLFWRYAA